MLDLSSIISAVVAFLVTALLGYLVIPYLKKLNYGQTILEDGPNWHQDKQGTPTMGGIMIIAGVIVSIAVSYGYSSLAGRQLSYQLGNSLYLTKTIAGIAFALCMACIGFADDYIKIVKKRNLGLTARQKTFFQLIVSAGYLTALCVGGMNSIILPFFGEVNIISGWGLLFWPIALMFVYGFTNAVNLTDGIDGLASSVTLVVACCFMLASGFVINAPVNAMASALAGACVGFICWNSKPAKVFMGDTGSMFLGGMVVALSFSIGRPVMLIFAGIVYLFEALSDIIQVAYYKKTKKRIFKMAPLHHHFEMCGWSEQKIVLVFSLVTFVGSFIALLPILFNF